MNITIQIDDKEHTIDDAVQDVFVESADVVRITTHMDEKEQAILGFMMKDFMQSDELKRHRCENEKLSVDSVALDKIIKIIEDWRECYAPDRAHITLDEISDIIDERGD